MKVRVGWGIGVAVVAVGGLWLAGNRAIGADTAAPAAVTTAAVSAAPAAGDAKFEYVGSSKCKKCHLAEYKSWEKTGKAHALETLMPGKAEEAKKAAKLDPAKDYSTDANCVKCHVTGMGEAGGYAIPDAKDEAAVKAASKLAHVGCESCHGPGSKYIEIFEDIFKSKRKYKVEELHAAGLNKIDASVCTKCHNDQGPTHKPFDFDKAKDQRDKIHEKSELKQREG